MAATSSAPVVQDLDNEDASLVIGMLASARLDQLNAFLVGKALAAIKQIDEPSLTNSLLHGLSMDAHAAT